MRNFIILLYIFAISGLTALVSCNTESRQQQAVTSTNKTSNSDELNDKDGTIQFRRTKVAKERDTLSFDLPQEARVRIKLKTPTNTGNLRINQLIMPDGTADGPYGRELSDSLTKIGTYQIIIGESLMQGDPYAGDYFLKIEID
ncbi:hypothetical protein HP439_07430 [Sphingobacterium shayense]|uniref:hypothetical protein n=1 Tax=Sphingobacterium shayense TaxID=626343 RepID=UPI001555B16D|nr:hypothetical protein [Sphingobacterium shayense]NQD70547.1 hypothetical protein [Sphingobacterium shayense]